MKLNRLGATIVVALTAATTLAACGDDNPTGSGASGNGSAASGDKLSGSLRASGASSQESAMTAWIAGYQIKQPDVNINYNSIGSGGGRTNLIAGAVEFAGSDAALKKDEQDKLKASTCPSGAMNLPVYISPVAVPYNVKGVDELNLKPDTLAQIFDRKITTWNDAKIKADNPNANLPATKITVVNRSDESGTTENFTEYLAVASPNFWKHEPDKAWPVKGGEAAAQTTGVVQVVASTDGAITYADASAVGTLKSAKIGVGDEFVAYSPEAAAKVVDASKADTSSGVEGDLALHLARDTTESGAYPIVLVSYHIVCKEYKDVNKAKMVKDFVAYVASEEGQKTAAQAAHSAPISAKLRDDINKSLDLIKTS